jgi:transcriptional regulator with XRE-family HTH domain
MIFKQLGSKIKVRRLELRMTQENLAEKVGISTNFMGQIERGDRKLSIETLVSISNNLNLSIDYLLSDSIVVKNENFANEISEIISGMDYTKKLFILDFIKNLKKVL